MTTMDDKRIEIASRMFTKPNRVKFWPELQDHQQAQAKYQFFPLTDPRRYAYEVTSSGVILCRHQLRVNEFPR